MFGLGMPELLLVLIVGLLLFGPKKLPELGHSLGKAIKSFKEGLNDTGIDEGINLPAEMVRKSEGGMNAGQK